MAHCQGQAGRHAWAWHPQLWRNHRWAALGPPKGHYNGSERWCVHSTYAHIHKMAVMRPIYCNPGDASAEPVIKSWVCCDSVLRRQICFVPFPVTSLSPYDLQLLPVSAPLSLWLSPSPDSCLVQFHVSPSSSSDSCLNGRIRPTTRLDLLRIYKKLCKISLRYIVIEVSPWRVPSHSFMITHTFLTSWDSMDVCIQQMRVQLLFQKGSWVWL